MLLNAISAIEPAISTPVGPPPTTTKFKYFALFSIFFSFSAFSNALNSLSRICKASLIPLSPFEYLDQSSLPK